MEPVEELSVSGLQTLLSDFSSGVLGDLNLDFDFDFDFVGGSWIPAHRPWKVKVKVKVKV